MIKDVFIYQENSQQDFERFRLSPGAESVLGFDAQKQPTTYPLSGFGGQQQQSTEAFFSDYELTALWLETARGRNRRDFVRPRELQKLEQYLNFYFLG